MDLSQFQIAGISVFALVIGLVQFLKSALSIKDKAAEVLTVGVGFAFISLAYAINSGYVPGVALPYINIVVVGLGGAMALAGYYKLVKAAATGVLSRFGPHKPDEASRCCEPKVIGRIQGHDAHWPHRE